MAEGDWRKWRKIQKSWRKMTSAIWRDPRPAAFRKQPDMVAVRETLHETVCDAPLLLNSVRTGVPVPVQVPVSLASGPRPAAS